MHGELQDVVVQYVNNSDLPLQVWNVSASNLTDITTCNSEGTVLLVAPHSTSNSFTSSTESACSGLIQYPGGGTVPQFMFINNGNTVFTGEYGQGQQELGAINLHEGQSWTPPDNPNGTVVSRADSSGDPVMQVQINQVSSDYSVPMPDVISPGTSIASGQVCTITAWTTFWPCQQVNMIGAVNQNVRLEFVNTSSSSNCQYTVNFVGLHGAPDNVTISPGKSASEGLGAGHFGTLQITDTYLGCTLEVNDVGPG